MRQRKHISKAAGIFFASVMLLVSLPFSARAAGTTFTDILEYEGVEYGKITLTGDLGDSKKVFSIDGDTVNWSYNNVAKESACIIEPFDFGGYMSIMLDSYTVSGGVYSYNMRDDWTATQLLADGKCTVGFGSFPYDAEYKPYFTSPGHPASFVFGYNSGETPIYGGEYEFTLYPDGTMYILRCEVYDKTGAFIIRFNKPYFVDGSSGGTAAAQPTNSAVFINGKSIAFDAYTIDGNNYFKLRDLAKVLSGTKKQFAVTWDGEKNAINLISTKPYAIVGGEMTAGDGAAKNAKLNASAVYLDGKPITIAAYTIDGNNYFKLRDIGKTFDFDVSWDGAKNAISVETSMSYDDLR